MWQCSLRAILTLLSVTVLPESREPRAILTLLSVTVLPESHPDSSALFFQTLDINWTGMTNLLDIPGLRYWGPLGTFPSSIAVQGSGFRDAKQ